MSSRHGLTAILGAISLALTQSLLALPQPSGSEVPDSVTALIRSRLSDVASPDPSQLGKALGVEPPSKEQSSNALQNRLQDLGDLGGDGNAEYALIWTGQPSLGGDKISTEEADLTWSLLLVAWDGLHWQASPLMSGFEPFMIQALPKVDSQQEIAVIVLAGATDIPYPTVFRFRSHIATLVWDGRSDESRYEGFDNGRLSFRAVNGVLQMIATGRADPGLLVFPKNGGRGFGARTVYNWDHDSFIPSKTEYTANADYSLYRFIAALHLHDFKTAYGLTDPAKFMNTGKPSLPAFRKLIEDKWPEFLDDRIFHARDSSPSDFAFTLSMPDKVFVYSPEFSGESHLLSGLSRQEHKPEED